MECHCPPTAPHWVQLAPLILARSIKTIISCWHEYLTEKKACSNQIDPSFCRVGGFLFFSPLPAEQIDTCYLTPKAGDSSADAQSSLSASASMEGSPPRSGGVWELVHMCENDPRSGAVEGGISFALCSACCAHTSPAIPFSFTCRGFFHSTQRHEPLMAMSGL